VLDVLLLLILSLLFSTKYFSILGVSVEVQVGMSLALNPSDICITIFTFPVTLLVGRFS